MLQQVVRHQHHRHLGSGSSGPVPCGRCAAASGRTAAARRPVHGSTSPSITVPSGSSAPTRLDLGEPVRDQLLAARPQEGPPAAADQLRADAVPLPLHLPFGHARPAPPAALQRVGQEERVRAADIGVARFRARRARRQKSGVGCQSPMSRCATVSASRPLTAASARTTRLCETPTRNSPVMSLFQTKRCRSSISRQAPDQRTRAAASSSCSRRGSRRSSIQ